MPADTRPIAAVILAAGKGTRMKSELPKVLHPLMGKPIVSYVIDACQKAKSGHTILVIGHKAEQVMEVFGEEYEYAMQTEQLGTGHALMIAATKLKSFKGDLLVLAGDTPFLTGKILNKLIRTHQSKNAVATMITAFIDPPLSYGRIIRDDKKVIKKIVEARDAAPEELTITEINTSHYCFQAEKVLPLLSELKADNDQGEYYLTDIIHLLVSKNERIESIVSEDPNIIMRINDQKHLSEAHDILKYQAIRKWSEKGVTFIDPSSTYIEPDVKIGADTTIYPFTSLTGKTIIKNNCIIGPNVKLKNAKIEPGCKIEFSVIEDRKISQGKTIGPFAAIYGEKTDK